MKVVLALTLCLLAVAQAAQFAFTADFAMTHPLMRNGITTGKIYYDYEARAFKLVFPTKGGYYELFDYNPSLVLTTQRGYLAGDNPFLDQWVYKAGHTCACETGPHDHAMPRLFVDTVDNTAGPDSPAMSDASGSEITINGVRCLEYTRKPGTPSFMSKYYATADGTPCRMTLTDLREFTFTNIQFGSPTTANSTVFLAPEGCRCGKPVDIVVVLDRSGSISRAEFVDQKNFTVGFANAFQFGPLNAALSLVHFKAESWVTLQLADGANPDNVKLALDNFQCCSATGSATSSCCCCGTSISAGIRAGAQQMMNGRRDAAKVMLVISDGYHNTAHTGGGCGSNCAADLQAAVDFAHNNVANLLIYAVGVGSDRDVSLPQQLIIASNYPERVLRRSDFAALAADSLQLVARACQENINPCGGCCGFCVCGQCLPPDVCVQSGGLCEENRVSGTCCKPFPKDCDEPGNKCNTYSCNPTNGSCVATPIPCRPSTECFTYRCEKETGQCRTEVNSANPSCSTQFECTDASDCNDGSLCTDDDCVNQQCRWTPVTCDDGNACTDDVCLPASGCSVIPFTPSRCDDDNNCTIDWCDPNGGCQHNDTSYLCDDNNTCTIDVCDPVIGRCVSTPKICAATLSNTSKADNCRMGFCDGANGGACSSRKVACGAPTGAIIGGLAAGAIVGIVIAIVVALALLGGGGVYAYSQAQSSSNVAAVSNNPIYVGNQAQGTNPLYHHA